MDVKKLKELFIEHKLFVKESNSNFILRCIYCGDHKNESKQGHLYVSKNKDKQLYHCFYCEAKGQILKLVKDLFGNNKKVIKELNLSSFKIKKNSIQTTKNGNGRNHRYILPKIDFESFLKKRQYMKFRAGRNPEEVENLIFNFHEFFNINSLTDVKTKYISNLMFDELHNKFIGFLTRNHTKLICRRINDDSEFKFMKFDLQPDKFNMLDYYYIRGNDPTSNIIVLTEGPFNILKEYVNDTLKLKNQVRLYASGQSFSYSALLKSICFDEHLFKPKVVILSDRDKHITSYDRFKKENKHIIKNLQIFYNRNGKDFGCTEVQSFKGVNLRNNFANLAFSHF
tara:strand:- start:3399 stop:4421 length:1023 start_codon:yes stop_codon:yes gene_type:complete